MVGTFQKKHILFDFDGVLVETNTIRIEGFRWLFGGYPENQLQQIIRYATANAGKSRYEKIKYFFEKIRGETINDNDLDFFVKKYSELVKQKVIDAEPVNGSSEFLSCYYEKYDFAIVSGSDQEELKEVCRSRKINQFFVEILGSPASKEDNISTLISRMGWGKERCLFVGDSTSDLDAAQASGIDFIGRDSSLVDWNQLNNIIVIKDLSQLPLYLD